MQRIGRKSSNNSSRVQLQPPQLQSNHHPQWGECVACIKRPSLKKVEWKIDVKYDFDPTEDKKHGWNQFSHRSLKWKAKEVEVWSGSGWLQYLTSVSRNCIWINAHIHIWKHQSEIQFRELDDGCSSVQKKKQVLKIIHALSHWLFCYLIWQSCNITTAAAQTERYPLALLSTLFLILIQLSHHLNSAPNSGSKKQRTNLSCAAFACWICMRITATTAKSKE